VERGPGRPRRARLRTPRSRSFAGHSPGGDPCVQPTSRLLHEPAARHEGRHGQLEHRGPARESASPGATRYVAGRRMPSVRRAARAAASLDVHEPVLRLIACTGCCSDSHTWHTALDRGGANRNNKRRASQETSRRRRLGSGRRARTARSSPSTPGPGRTSLKQHRTTPRPVGAGRVGESDLLVRQRRRALDGGCARSRSGAFSRGPDRACSQTPSRVIGPPSGLGDLAGCRRTTAQERKFRITRRAQLPLGLRRRPGSCRRGVHGQRGSSAHGCPLERGSRRP
jgi:hypothetical protein